MEVLKIDVKNIEDEIKKTKKYIKYCDENNMNIEFVYNGKKINNKNLEFKDLYEIMTAINKKDKKDRYEYIYDTVCKYLDERINTGYCMFKDDICIRDRLKNNNHKNGCCECTGRGKCKYLIDSKCTLGNCMACKLFTCSTLRKLGVSQSINDYVLTKYFFTNKQKDILKFSYWTPRKIVIERLLNNEYVRP